MTDEISSPYIGAHINTQVNANAKLLDRLVLLPYYGASVWRYRLYRWLKGLLTDWIEKGFDASPGWFRNTLLFLVITTWRIVHFVLRGLELEVIHAVGREKESGEMLSVVYVGDKNLCRSIVFRVLSGNATLKKMGRISVWRLRDFERSVMDWADIVFIEISRLVPHSIESKRGIVIENPGKVLMVMPFEQGEAWETIHRRLVKKQRLNVKRFNDMGFRLVKGDAKRDFDFYYDRMYLPMIDHRHSLYAEITPREAFRKLAQKCELWFVENPEGQRVGAMVWANWGKIKHGLAFGILDGDFRYEEQGALACVYYHGIQMAYEQGARLLNGTQAPAFENDGLYQHKHRWGFKAIEDPWYPSKLLIWVPNNSPTALGWLERMRPIRTVPSVYEY